MRVPLAVVNPKLARFASAAFPLRPSRVAKLLACPLSVILSMHEEDDLGGRDAQTGNLLHAAVATFHTTTDREARTAAGLQALEAAREKFPGGDPKEARKIYDAYVADPANADAKVKWCEQAVKLVLPAHPMDPTGADIVIAGTLDQVRLGADGALRVWDVKTGDRLPPEECLDEYLVQQSVYVLAARATLDPTIQCGGLIYTPNYFRARAKAHRPYAMTVEDCEAAITMLPLVVANVRAGNPTPRPGADACRFCDHKRYPKCLGLFRGFF